MPVLSFACPELVNGVEGGLFLCGISKVWKNPYFFLKRRFPAGGFAGEKQAARPFAERFNRTFDNARYAAGSRVVVNNGDIDE